MRKFTVALGLAAVVAGLFAAGSSARAANDLSPADAQLAQPKLGDLKLKIAPQIAPNLLFARRAELTSQLFVVNTGNPSVKLIWCLVKNHGFKASGPTKTLIRVWRNGSPFPVQGMFNTPGIAPGGHYWIGAYVYAPYGLKRVFSYADATHIEPEYIETNNWDSLP